MNGEASPTTMPKVAQRFSSPPVAAQIAQESRTPGIIIPTRRKKTKVTFPKNVPEKTNEAPMETVIKLIPGT
jgi:hypothetical protein